MDRFWRLCLRIVCPAPVFQGVQSSRRKQLPAIMKMRAGSAEMPVTDRRDGSGMARHYSGVNRRLVVIPRNKNRRGSTGPNLMDRGRAGTKLEPLLDALKRFTLTTAMMTGVAVSHASGSHVSDASPSAMNEGPTSIAHSLRSHARS